jgi:hypothetical protein
MHEMHHKKTESKGRNEKRGAAKRHPASAAFTFLRVHGSVMSAPIRYQQHISQNCIGGHWDLVWMKCTPGIGSTCVERRMLQITTSIKINKNTNI